jgi:hypothetical protein
MPPLKLFFAVLALVLFVVAGFIALFSSPPQTPSRSWWHVLTAAGLASTVVAVGPW